MSARQKPGARAKRGEPRSELVWERPEPPKRPAPGPLSRDKIVRAAVKLADAEGLAAVSLRKVGAALDAGPMRLYGYLSTKEELLELMVDAVYGEMADDVPRRGDWCAALRVMARRIARAAADHPWLIDLLGGRPHLGPSALSYLEAVLAAVSSAPGFDDIDDVLLAVNTVLAYVIGALRSAERERVLDKEAWQAATGPYMQRMIATGRFPTLRKVFRDATHPPVELKFEQGLECVLDGIAARVGRVLKI